MHRPVADKAQRGPQAHWTCPRCGHQNNPRLGHCAKCSLRRPQRPDPTRVTAP